MLIPKPDDGPVFFDMEEERIRKRELEEARIRAEMEEKMKVTVVMFYWNL